MTPEPITGVTPLGGLIAQPITGVTAVAPATISYPTFLPPTATIAVGNRSAAAPRRSYIEPQVAIVVPPPLGASDDLVAALVTAGQNSSPTTPYKIYLLEGSYPIANTVAVFGHIVIIGRGANQTAIYQSGSQTVMGGIFTVPPGGILEIRNVTVRSGRARVTPQPVSGGAIWGQGGQIRIYDAIFYDNQASSLGGAIATGGTSPLMIERSIFNTNRADGSGGAIWTDANLNIRCVRFVSNSAVNGGGAIARDRLAPHATLSASSFLNNFLFVNPAGTPTPVAIQHIFSVTEQPPIYPSGSFWQPTLTASHNVRATPTGSVELDPVTGLPECQMQSPEPLPYARPQTNLVLNGDFSSAWQGLWEPFGLVAGFPRIVPVSGNPLLEIARPSGSADAGIYQFPPNSALPEQATAELVVSVGNASNTRQVITVLVRKPDWSESYSCSWVALEPFTPLTRLTIQMRTRTSWTTALVQVFLASSTGQPVVRLDDVDLRFKPDLDLPAGVNNRCLGSIVVSTPTPFQTPTRTPTPIPTITGTRTATRTLSPTPTITPTLDLTCNNNDRIINLTSLESYQANRVQVLEDMGVTSDAGLYPLSGPTINSRRVGAPIAWGSLVQVQTRVFFPELLYAQQNWYQVALPAGGSGWIVVSFQGKTYTAIQDPCFQIGAPSNFIFTYDRLRAASYAIEHSYQNDVVSPLPNRVTRRLTPSPGMTPVPYAFFYYSDISGQDFATGSAAFVSEALWMGGMPMTLGDQYSCFPPTPTVTTTPPTITPTPFPITIAEAGWRYCHRTSSNQPGNASFTWDVHSGIVAYYTTSQAPADPCPGNDIVNSILSGSSQGSLVTFLPPIQFSNRIVGRRNARLDETLCDSPQTFAVQSDLTGLVDLNAGVVRDANGLGNKVYGALATLQTGDYVWINPFILGQNREADTHGLLVVGWGDILDCPTVVNPTDSNYRRTINSFSPTSVSGRVPWVVDFTRAQSPVPRPFYCTAYLEANQTNFGIHDWYFYTMPSTITIPRTQLYVDQNWAWTVSD